MTPELTGNRFGRLSVLYRAGTVSKRTMWACLCECGRQITTSTSNLTSGQAKSCGCLKLDMLRERQTRHGMYGSPTYKTWASMIRRCTDLNHIDAHLYAARGITVCERWREFRAFLEDMGERPEGKTLDRVNPDGNYEPSNCRWATLSEQAFNRRKKAGASNG